MLTSLISVMIFLAVFGAIFYMLQTYVPMPAPVKTVMTIIFVLFACVFLLQAFGAVDIGGLGFPGRHRVL